MSLSSRGRESGLNKNEKRRRNRQTPLPKRKENSGAVEREKRKIYVGGSVLKTIERNKEEPKNVGGGGIEILHT